jgi:hypothetical protein
MHIAAKDSSGSVSGMLTLDIPQGTQTTEIEILPGAPGAQAENLEDAFTPEDAEAALQGDSVEIKLIIEKKEKASVPEDAGLIEAKTGERTIGLFLDISLLRTITAAQDRSVTSTPVTQTDIKLKITLELPEALRGKEDYSVIRVHEGTAAVMDTAYDSTAQTLAFETDRFSTYAIAYKDSGTEPPPQPPDPPNPPRPPRPPAAPTPGGGSASSGSSGGGSSGGGGGGGSNSPATVSTYWIEVPEAQRLAATAKASALAGARSSGASITGIRAEPSRSGSRTKSGSSASTRPACGNSPCAWPRSLT